MNSATGPVEYLAHPGSFTWDPQNGEEISRVLPVSSSGCIPGFDYPEISQESAEMKICPADWLMVEPDPWTVLGLTLIESNILQLEGSASICNIMSMSMSKK